QPQLELALERPRVEVDPEALERSLDLLQHRRNGIARRAGQLLDVGPAVAVLRRLLAAPPRLDGGPEPLHLSPRVVVVVLALDLVGRELEQARDRVAVRAVPRRRDGERAGRVRRDHLDLDALPSLRLRAAAVP